jgi:selenocysteine lyase/cysteine desulfurase
VDLGGCVASLDKRGFTVRAVPDTNSVRVSCAFFNTPAEIDGLVKALVSSTAL